MPDREKIIEQLKSMCDYHRSVGNNITADIANDALQLLKEQKAEIRQLRLALDIAKGTCNGIKVKGR